MNDPSKALANKAADATPASEATPLYQLDTQDADAFESANLPAAATQKPPVDPLLISDNSSPQDLVEWGLKKFADQKLVITSSFGMEGCALIDMCNKAIEANGLDPITVAYIDTAFFFPETHQLRKS